MLATNVTLFLDFLFAFLTVFLLNIFLVDVISFSNLPLRDESLKNAPQLILSDDGKISLL